MESACNLHRLKMLNEWLTKLLPLLMPWVLVPLGFSVFAAFLHGCANNSLQEVLVYVVVPMAIWMGFHNYCGASTYKPTFSPSSVAALITFMVGTYVSTLSTATHALFDGAFGVTSLLLVFTFWRMIRSDPGRLVPASAVMSIPGQLEQVNIKQIHADVPRAVEYADSIRLIGDFSTFMEINLHKESQHRNECSSCDRNQSFRTKHCKYCNVCIERYDHHCPAIYNCVGRKNHLLFLLMLVNFLIVEALFIISVDAYLVANHPARKLTTSVDEGRYLNYGNWTWQDISELLRRNPLVFSTAIFVGIQSLWQAPFLVFHIYCACNDLTTDEMFHWQNYEGLYVETPPDVGKPWGGKEFVNPYSKGLRKNVIKFLSNARF